MPQTVQMRAGEIPQPKKGQIRGLRRVPPAPNYIFHIRSCRGKSHHGSPLARVNSLIWVQLLQVQLEGSQSERTPYIPCKT